MTTTVVDKARQLLDAGDNDAVVQLIEKLQETHLMQLRALNEAARKGQIKSEGVSTARLIDLFALPAPASQTVEDNESDKKLKDAAALPNPDQPTKPRKPPPRRRPIPESFPRVVNDIVVPDAERPCPQCGGARGCIGHEVTEVIDIEPARIVVREDRREKLACKSCEGEVVCAPLGDKVVEGGAYSARLVADVMSSKFADGLPLNRQHERYKRLGFDMPLATMGDQVGWASELLEPVARGIGKELLQSTTMHLDATSIAVRDKDTPKGIRLGSMWGYVGVTHVVNEGISVPQYTAVYLYTSTGKAHAQQPGEIGPSEMLELRRESGMPHVCADAAGIFDASFNRAGLIEVGCNMHGRRYFAKALDGGDNRAALPIAAYKKLYVIEEKIRGKPPDEMHAVRTAESKPVFDELLRWCAHHFSTEPPKSLLGKAVGYFVRHSDALGRFLDDGRLPIDNGVVERLHRLIALGRRNFLFCGSDSGARRAAIGFTVVANCKLLGIDPVAYLSSVLPVLARGIVESRDVPALLPSAWRASRA